MKTALILTGCGVSLLLGAACVSSSGDETAGRRTAPFNLSENDGRLDVEGEVYPWLSPKYDKGIYASSADTAPFKDNPFTYQNMSPRIERTSKRARKK